LNEPERQTDAVTPPAMPSARELEQARAPRRLSLVLSDGYQTGVLHHRGRGATRRLPVLYVHGIQSHPGWFVGSSAALADDGHDVFQVVRRGSGDNVVARGHAASAEQLLDDVWTACRFVLEHTGCRRLHLLGASWGGKLLACYAADGRRSAEIASLTMIAPGIAPTADVSVFTKLKIAAALLMSPRQLFDMPLNDVELFTDNEPMRQYLRSDPCRLLRATARFLYASRRLDVRLRSAPRGTLAMPVTLVLASKDRIIDNGATEAVVQRLSRNLHVSLLDGAHTLEFEPEPANLYRVLAEAMAEPL